MQIKMVERYSAAKTGDESLNEDALVVTPNFLAVIDGSSLAAHERFNNMTGGRFAAQNIAQNIGKLPHDIDAPNAVDFLSRNLRDALDSASAEQGQPRGRSLAAAGMVVYSRHRNEIWGVADCPFAVDGQVHETQLKLAAQRAQLRKYLIHSEIADRKAKGQTESQIVADLLENDPTPNIIAKGIMANSRTFANNDDPVFGYGVINGDTVPRNHIRVVQVGQAREIILASDGYPKIFNTLAKTEQYLADVNARDPLCYLENPQPKAVKGGRYYDDVSYMRFRLKAPSNKP